MPAPAISFLFQIQRMLAEKMHKGAAHDQSKNQQYRCKIQRQLPGDFIAHALSPRNGTYAPNGLDLPLLVFKLIHLGPQALDM